MANQKNIIGSAPETWGVLKFTVPSGGVVVGDFHKEQKTWGIVYGADGIHGEDDGGDVTIPIDYIATLIYKILKIKVNKAAGSGYEIYVGDALYLNTTTKVVSATKGGSDVYIGVCEEDATATATWVWAGIDGKDASLTAA